MQVTVEEALAVCASDIRVCLVDGGVEVGAASDTVSSSTVSVGMRIGDVAIVVLDAADEFAASQTGAAEVAEIQAAALNKGAHPWSGLAGEDMQTATAEAIGAPGVGVKVHFRPESVAAAKAYGCFGAIARRLREMTFLEPGLGFVVADERNSIAPDADEVVSDVAAEGAYAVLPPTRLKPRRLMATDDGLAGLIRFINRTKTPIQRDVIAFRTRESGRELEVAMQWNAGYSHDVRCYINGVHASTLGGAHQSGFRSALTTVVNRCGRKQRLFEQTREGVDADDVTEGLAAVIRLRVDNPRVKAVQQPSADSRPEFVGTEIGKFVQRVCDEQLTSWFEANPSDASTVVQKAIWAKEARTTSRRSNCRG